jgi:hypothetical protein
MYIRKKKYARRKRVVRGHAHHPTYAHPETLHDCTRHRLWHAVMQCAVRGHDTHIARPMGSVGTSASQTTQITLEIQAAAHKPRKPITDGTRIAANGGAYEHGGTMHQDGRRSVEVSMSKQWYTSRKKDGCVTRVGSVNTPTMPIMQNTQATKTAAQPLRRGTHTVCARGAHRVRTQMEEHEPFKGCERRYAERTACGEWQKQRSQWHQVGTDRSIGKHSR